MPTIVIDSEKGLLKINVIDLKDGLYFSKSNISKNDLNFKFFDFMIKKNNFIENKNPFLHIIDDINNLIASVEKINFFSEQYSLKDSLKLCRYASVELESIFQNSRAIFDNLQVIQDNLIKSTKSLDGSEMFSINEIRFGYKENRKVIKNLTIDDYINKYKIPELLAKFYFNIQEFFFFILDTRNDVFHSRKTFDLYLSDKGFSISLERYNIEDLHIWNENNVLPNKLGSLKTLVSYIVLNTINVLEEYVKVISLIIQLPDDISPEYNLYLRNEFNDTLNELHSYGSLNAWNNKEKNEKE